MALSPGTRLGPYEILALLGAGGMGEVYRAQDTRLSRVVAIKVLHAHLSSDTELRQRFEREARSVSSLSHPHICVLHDVGHQNGVDFLVMEYLEGETLAQRLAKGPLSPEQLFRCAIEIAGALDTAHRQGLIHRDLKPGNIMLTATGSKLLDFGLAKANPVRPLADLSSSPTRSQPVAGKSMGEALTAEGRIVGTFQYMAPEQLEGKEADARTDIFAFGAVLYEMATGRKAFQGKSQLSVASAILEKEPESLSSVRPTAPPALDRVVKRCLAKDPEERWQAARDLMLELKWIAETGSRADAEASRVAPVFARRRVRERLGWAAGVFLLAALTLSTLYFSRASPRAHPIWSFILPLEKVMFEFVPASGPAVISPDGSHLAFPASDSSGKRQLWVRPLDGLTAQPLAGTEGVSFLFWSADSRSIGFFADGKLKKIAVSGGPAQSLADATDGRGGAWNHDGVIIFSPNTNSPLFRVSASGGPASPATKLAETPRETSHRWPSFLPDGRHFLYVGGSPGLGNNGVYVGSLNSAERTLLVSGFGNAVYAPPGFLLFWREGSLMAQPFDARSRKLTGDAFPIAEQVQHLSSIGRTAFSVSENGILIYQGGGSFGNQLVWLDSSGKQVSAVGTKAVHVGVQLSPDGQRLAESIVDASGNGDIWLHDLGRNVPTRFTFEPSFEWYPVWSPDGSRLVFSSNRKGPYDLYVKNSSGAGTEEVLLESEDNKRPSDWSHDGRFIAYNFNDLKGKTNWDIWILPLFGDRKPFPFLRSQFNEGGAVFSPDGRWLAYESDESGKYEIYVAPFPGPGGKWQVSSGGGRMATWRRDGRGIFYRSPDSKMMAVDVATKGLTIQAGVPHALFQMRFASGPIFSRVYDVSPDGRRFLALSGEETASAPLTLVVNWSADLDK